MSKTNLERVRPTPVEFVTVSWDSNPNYSALRPDDDVELMASIRKKISDIWEENIVPKRWQMEPETVIPLESWADADPTVIPFWYGTKPKKPTRWESFKRLFR